MSPSLELSRFLSKPPFCDTASLYIIDQLAEKQVCNLYRKLAVHYGDHSELRQYFEKNIHKIIIFTVVSNRNGRIHFYLHFSVLLRFKIL